MKVLAKLRNKKMHKGLAAKVVLGLMVAGSVMVSNSVWAADSILGAIPGCEMTITGVTGGLTATSFIKPPSAAPAGTAASNANLTISGGNWNYVAGGYILDGDTNYNKVNITLNTGDRITDDVQGGRVINSGNANNNEVTITLNGEARLDGSIAGGEVYLKTDGNGVGNTDNNVITITMHDKSVIYGNIAAGSCYSADGNTVGNVTNITMDGAESKIDGSVWGAFCKFGAAQDNVVNLKMTNGAVIDKAVWAGVSWGRGASGNVLNLNMDNAYIGQYVRGGQAEQGAAAFNNTVKATLTGDSEVDWAIRGGMTTENTTSADAYGNKVNLSLADKSRADNGAAGGHVEEIGNAYDNTVVINMVDESYVKNNTYGGYVYKNGDAHDNKVDITMNGKNDNNCIYGTVNGGYVNENGNAYNNEVNLTMSGDSIVRKDVRGGYAKNGYAYDNVVNLLNAKVVGTVYGGYSDAGAEHVYNNTINLAGKNTVKAIAGYDKLNFYVDDKVAYGDTMLKITDAASEVDAGKVTVYLDGSPSAGTPETIVTLVDTEGTITGTADNMKIIKGTTLDYTGEVAFEQKDKTLKLNFEIEEVEDESPIITDPPVIEEPPTPPVDEGTRPTFTDDGKSLMETRAAAAFTVNSMADFMQGVGMEQANAAVSDGGAGEDMTPFAAVGGNKMRYETGSHIDVKGWNGVVGLAKKAKNNVFGIAVEHSNGNYDSYLDSGFHGKGDIKATGAVIFGEAKRASGVHFDAAIRAGKVKSDYASDKTAYDEKSTYYGASLGLGKLFKVGEKSNLDIYGRYFYSHTADADVTLPLGEKVAFDAVNSHRLRIGGRYLVDLNKASQAYAGMAWQYEFSGDAKASINGYTTAAPSLKGHSGMLELGYKTQAGKNLMLDFNLNGFVGKQRGVSGGVNLQWKF